MTDFTWRPCMKRPVVVHVRDATPGEEVFTREGLAAEFGNQNTGPFDEVGWIHVQILAAARGERTLP